VQCGGMRASLSLYTSHCFHVIFPSDSAALCGGGCHCCDDYIRCCDNLANAPLNDNVVAFVVDVGIYYAVVVLAGAINAVSPSFAAVAEAIVHAHVALEADVVDFVVVALLVVTVAPSTVLVESETQIAE
jgi:hypothetical protein